MSKDVIYLINSEDGLLWCEDPAPGEEQKEEDAIKYIREDKFLELEIKMKKIQDWAITASACLDLSDPISKSASDAFKDAMS